MSGRLSVGRSVPYSVWETLGKESVYCILYASGQFGTASLSLLPSPHTCQATRRSGLWGFQTRFNEIVVKINHNNNSKNNNNNNNKHNNNNNNNNSYLHCIFAFSHSGQPLRRIVSRLRSGRSGKINRKMAPAAA